MSQEVLEEAKEVSSDGVKEGSSNGVKEVSSDGLKEVSSGELTGVSSNGLKEVSSDGVKEVSSDGVKEVSSDELKEVPEYLPVELTEKVHDYIPEVSQENSEEVKNFKFRDYYDLPVKRMIYGDMNFPVLDNIVRIRGTSMIVRIIFAQPPDGTKPDRRHCLQIQLAFSHVHKFLFLDPDLSNGSTVLAVAISDVAVLRINGALSSALGEKVHGHPSRRYIFFDVMFNIKNPQQSSYWKELMRYIERGYNSVTKKRLEAEQKVLSEKDFVEFEKNVKVPVIGFIRKETLMELLKFADIQIDVVHDNDDREYIVFTSAEEKMAKIESKREYPQITINDISIPRLDKSDIVFQDSASGRLEFNSNDLALLKPNAWLNDKIVDWYSYFLLKQMPEEKQLRVRLCETHFYTSVTKGIENETNPTRLKAGIYQNYDPKKFKQSFFDFDFIVCPIHRLNHWFLIVIVDPKAAISSIEASDSAAEVIPCHFLIFDSFKKLATNEHDITFDHLTYFLARHYDDVKSNLATTDNFNRALVKKVFPENLPQQTNADDCGVYSLMFLKYFFEHLPDDKTLPDFTQWWKTFTIQGMRNKIYTEVITTATNFEEIKRRHEAVREPPAKKTKIQMLASQPIYRIAVPAFPRASSNTVSNITFRPRAPGSVRALGPAPRASRGRGGGVAGATRKPPQKRGPRKKAVPKDKEALDDSPPILPAEEPQSVEAKKPVHKTMNLEISDKESDS